MKTLTDCLNFSFVKLETTVIQFFKCTSEVINQPTFVLSRFFFGCHKCSSKLNFSKQLKPNSHIIIVQIAIDHLINLQGKSCIMLSYNRSQD